SFLDFMRRLYSRYQFRILRVADLQRELEDYTGRSWKQFFDDWLYSKGMTDWCLEKVEVEQNSPRTAYAACGRGLARPEPEKMQENQQNFPLPLPPSAPAAPIRACKPRTQSAGNSCRVTVLLRQKAEINEPTVLGFCLDGSDGYQVRIPIQPGAPLLELNDP